MRRQSPTLGVDELESWRIASPIFPVMIGGMFVPGPVSPYEPMIPGPFEVTLAGAEAVHASPAGTGTASHLPCGVNRRIKVTSRIRDLLRGQHAGRTAVKFPVLEKQNVFGLANTVSGSAP